MQIHYSKTQHRIRLSVTETEQHTNKKLAASSMSEQENKVLIFIIVSFLSEHPQRAYCFLFLYLK
jgi:hypothetical protein